MTAPEVKLSARLQTIMDHRHDHYDRAEIGVRDPLYRRIFAECPDEIKALQFAKGFAYFLKHKKILICEYDILAGYPYRYTYEATMAINMPSDFDPQFRPLRMSLLSGKHRTVLIFIIMHLVRRSINR